MKRFLYGALLLGVVLVGLVAQSVPAQAANTDNFTITKFEAEYRLGRDTKKRSTLEAKLTITADFPPRQNHGLAPLFVTRYDGHSTSFQLRSVTDEKGSELEHQWDGERLLIGNKDTYVEGQKTYVITYTQRDVTKHYADTARDEFYWDVIGTDWRVPMRQVAVSVTLDEALRSELLGEPACYWGSHGSATRCLVGRQQAAYQTRIGYLAKGQGVTMAFGFKEGTFAAYQKSTAEKLAELWLMVQIPASIAAVATLIWLVVRYLFLVGRRSELRPIVPEYLPPQMSVATSGYVLHRHDWRKGSPMAAQLVDLAVRHFIKIYQVREAKGLRSAQYEIEITKRLDTLRPEEHEVLKDMFGGRRLTIGQKLNLKTLRNNTSYAQRTMDDDKKLRQLVRGQYGLYEKNPAHRRRIRRWAFVSLVAAVLLLSPAWLMVAFIMYCCSFGWSLTNDGLALRRYLQGLKLYIKVGEAERLQMLQSPEGAEKVKIDTHDEKQLIKLYERLLPYAVLFGQEKQWTAELGKYYESSGAQPGWYTGQGNFSAAMFVAGMNSLSTTTSTISSYSSSSGGSSGGGFSGGGGGGGGGGGW